MIYRTLILIILFNVLPVKAKAYTLLVLGDSISAAYGIPIEKGWVSLLKQRLVQNHYDYNVINASIAGETTMGAKVRLPALLQEYKPDIVVIELGGNDGLRGIHFSATENNLIEMIQMIKAVDRDVLLVAMEMPPNLGLKYTEGFASIYKNVSKKRDVPVSTFILQNIADVPGLMQSDGMHPVASAQRIMLDNIWPSLAELLNKTL